MRIADPRSQVVLGNALVPAVALPWYDYHLLSRAKLSFENKFRSQVQLGNEEQLGGTEPKKLHRFPSSLLHRSLPLFHPCHPRNPRSKSAEKFFRAVEEAFVERGVFFAAQRGELFQFLALLGV